MIKKGWYTPFNFAAYLAISILICSQLSCKPNRKSDRLIVASSGKITSLDPAQASTFHALQILSSLGDPLYRVTKEGDLIPSLAKDLPTVSKDGLTISIPLRSDVFFHDGTKFNAKAMEFGLKRFQRIGTLNYILGGRIDSIEVSGEYAIRIKLTKPSSSITRLLTSINLTPISPKAYMNHKNNFMNERFIGTGPYKLTSFSPQKQRLEPFKDYWGEPPKNHGIDLINLSNSTSLFIALISGEIDVLLSSSMDEDQHHYLHKMSKEGKMNEGEGSALEIGYITFLSNKNPLNQESLRHALLYSFNRNLISERVSYNLRKPLKTLVPPTLKTKPYSPWPNYNPDKAKSLIRKAGYCDNKKLELSLTYRSNVPADKLMALTWKSQIEQDLSDCLKLNLNGVESTTVYRQLSKGSFQVVMLDWRGAYPDPEAYLAPLLSCNKINREVCEEGEAVSSGSFWANSKIQTALITSDKLFGENRLKKLREIEELALNGAAYLPVWLVTPRAWSQPNLTNPEFDGAGNLRLNLLERID